MGQVVSFCSGWAEKWLRLVNCSTDVKDGPGWGSVPLRAAVACGCGVAGSGEGRAEAGGFAWDGSSGFILFGLDGRMASFGHRITAIPWKGAGLDGGLPGYRVAGQRPETAGLAELSHYRIRRYEIECWSHRRSGRAARRPTGMMPAASPVALWKEPPCRQSANKLRARQPRVV
jgi:hypothetical protein